MYTYICIEINVFAITLGYSQRHKIQPFELGQIKTITTLYQPRIIILQLRGWAVIKIVIF